MKLQKFRVGQRIHYGGVDWDLIDSDEQTFLCITTKPYVNLSTFNHSKNNNYAESYVRELLNTVILNSFLRAGAKERNFADIEVNLRSCDNFLYYGKVSDKIGLLDRDSYVKYCGKMRRCQTRWFLATAESCIRRDYIRVATPSGYTEPYPVSSQAAVRPVIRLYKDTTVFKAKESMYV